MAFTNNLRFPGQYYDKETGLHYNYFRDYDPNTGRYLESDPIGLAGGINTYGYVNGNPVNYIDLDGLQRGRTGRGRDNDERGRDISTPSTQSGSCPPPEDEEERCKTIIRGCRQGCVDEWVDDPLFVQKWGGSNGNEAIKNCIAVCAESFDCNYSR
ncbi:RHS repeat-associated core domain-containing protein [Methylosoma difficile]